MHFAVQIISSTKLIFIFLPFPDVEKEEGHPNLENVPSNLYESVCMPDFNEFFQQQGDNFPVTDHNKNTTMNNNNNTTGQQQQQQYMESKYPYLNFVIFYFRIVWFHKRHRIWRNFKLLNLSVAKHFKQ